MLAARGQIQLASLLSVLLGGSFVIACGCVFNNILDRDIDDKMTRTMKRPLVTGTIQPREALIYGIVLGVLGFTLLAWGTNPTTFMIGLIGLFFYVILYGWGKRNSVYGTIIGSISGATPPVAGYTAVTGHLDFGAFLLFSILVCWQIPHFYAIAIYRLKEYKRAGLPIWPAVKGIRSTKMQIAVFSFAFAVMCSTLTLFGYTGVIYLLLMGGLGFIWFYKALQGFGRRDNGTWAREIFGYSLLLSVALLIMLTAGPLLP